MGEEEEEAVRQHHLRLQVPVSPTIQPSTTQLHAKLWKRIANCTVSASEALPWCNRQSSRLSVSGFAGRYTACSCSREASCVTMSSGMRSSRRWLDLPAASSSRANAREATVHVGLQSRTPRVDFVQLAVSLLRARQAEQEGCHQLCRTWAD